MQYTKVGLNCMLIYGVNMAQRHGGSAHNKIQYIWCSVNIGMVLKPTAGKTHKKAAHNRQLISTASTSMAAAAAVLVSCC